jgi:hypothetical protein
VFLFEGEREVKHKVADRNAEGKLTGVPVTLKPDEASGFLAGGEFAIPPLQSATGADLRWGSQTKKKPEKEPL